MIRGVIMLGNHCMTSWSKTQEMITKSSAEAELYAVVRGGTEGLGMLTLLKDMGQQANLQLHLDATAAKSTVERQGLSKVRHVDVNVLWLQETCARKLIPLNKIPGEDNCSDMMTKHLVSAKLDRNLSRMRIEIAKGRSDKAAELHSIDKPIAPEFAEIRKKFEKEQGGDRWLSRGNRGVLQIIHSTPRMAMFTPYKVSKGPTAGYEFPTIRFTKGITKSGRRFEFHDTWERPGNRHRLFDEEWIGTTVFTNASTSIYDAS